VEEIAGVDGDDEPRRRYYRLTTWGKSVLTAEVSRLERVVKDAKLRLPAAKPRRA
jgi:hypothetical protein